MLWELCLSPLASMLRSLSPSSPSYAAQTAAVLQHRKNKLFGVAARLPFFVPPPGHNRRLLFRFLFHKVLSGPATSCAISIFGLQVCWICVVEIRFAVMVFASVVMVLYLLSTHPVSLTISAICSWKGRWAGQTFLAHCDNLTLNRQKQNCSSYWIRLESGILIPVSNEGCLYFIFCVFILQLNTCLWVPELLWLWKACVTWESVWINTWRKACVFWRLFLFTYYSVENGWSFSWLNQHQIY